MPVFFVSSTNISDNSIIIEGPLFEHLVKSLRFKKDNQIQVCDETRHRHYVTITTIKKRILEGEIIKSEQGPSPSATRIILGQSMLKGDHMTWAIQKATELGVSTIVPVLTERVIVQPKPDRYHALHERYTRIALDAAQQSERWDIPEVLPPTLWKDFLGNFGHATLTCILVEREHLPGLNSLSLDKEFQGSVVLLVGPEGGWTPEEKLEAERFHFTPISLGASILRGETAPLTAISIIQSRLGNLG